MYLDLPHKLLLRRRVKAVAATAQEQLNVHATSRSRRISITGHGSTPTPLNRRAQSRVLPHPPSPHSFPLATHYSAALPSAPSRNQVGYLQLVGDVTPCHVDAGDGVWQGEAFVHRHHVAHPVPRVQHHARRTPRCVQAQDRLWHHHVEARIVRLSRMDPYVDQDAETRIYSGEAGVAPAARGRRLARCRSRRILRRPFHGSGGGSAAPRSEAPAKMPDR